MYESGAGMVEYNAMMTGDETPGATEKYIAFNRDIRMYQVYKDYFLMFDKYNITENCHYANVALPSKYGSWHLMETQDQDINEAHRYRAFMELIDETRAPFKNYTDKLTCFGIASNSTDVCSRKGVCVEQDKCEPFLKPTPSAPIVIVPSEGDSLADKFYISSQPWVSRFSMTYAFGISLPGQDYRQITSNFTTSTSIVTILPYIGKPYKIVMLAKDPFGNVYTTVSNQLVKVKELKTQNVSSLIQNFTQDEKLIALLDKSKGVSGILSAEVLTSVNISAGDANSLKNLEEISLSFDTEPQILNNIKSKVSDLLSSDLTLTNDAIQSVVNIVSTIYTADSSNKDDSLINSLALLLVNSGSKQPLDPDAESLPEVSFESPSFKITVSSFDPGNLQKKYVKQSDFLAVDLSAIFMDNESQKASVTSIKYTADTSLSSVGFEKLDIKFFSADKVMNVSGLSEPIILQFNFDISKNEALQKSEVTCKYYDEKTGGWSEDGCVLNKIDYENGTVYCGCTHTTLFSIASEVNLDKSEEPKNSKNKALKTIKSRFLWWMIIGGYFLYQN